MDRQADLPGSIRWNAEVFAESSPSAGPTAQSNVRWAWLMVGIGFATVILVIIMAAQRSNPDASIVPASLVRLPLPPRAESPSGPVRAQLATPLPARDGRGPRTQAAGPVAPAGIARAQELGVTRLSQHFPIVGKLVIESATTIVAAGEIVDRDFVIGVELGDEARAYGLNMMGRTEAELLNDTLDGQPIAVTFCATCQSPLVFSRKVGDVTLTLFSSGELRGDNMVMQDRETGSKWTQLTGEAINGPLKGKHLRQIAAVWTDWKTWQAAHPATTAPKLRRLVENYQHHPLYSQFSPEQSFFFTLQWGLSHGQSARSWPYAQLAQQLVLNDTFEDEPVLVLFDAKTSTVTGFSRRVGNRELTFRSYDAHVTDDQTHSVWDPVTGRALEGTLKYQRLTPLPGIISLSWAWRNFFPQSEIWSADAGGGAKQLP